MRQTLTNAALITLLTSAGIAFPLTSGQEEPEQPVETEHVEPLDEQTP
ncbi:hypothetical protein [Exiguobacterium sp. s193]|nr:hypothetical protein [Exiguobacterium sp. s193]